MTNIRKRTRHLVRRHEWTNLLPSFTKFRSCTSLRSQSRLLVTDDENNPIGIIQMAGLPTRPRCVIWSEDRLVGQCAYEPKEGGWMVYPIRQGFLASKPLTDTDPLEYLVMLARESKNGNSAGPLGMT
jgi:hypothetical protein